MQIETFDTNEGRFASVPAASGTSLGFTAAGTTIDFDGTVGHTSAGSQLITVNDDATKTAATGYSWRIRNLSGGGTPANNVTLTADGYIGFWVKTTTANLQVSMIIDDVVGTTTQNERGRYQDVINDGEWHAYEWNFDATTANTEWFNFNAGNGLITASTVTVDAVYFLMKDSSPTGEDRDAVLSWDDLSVNTEGSIVPEPASMSLAMLGGLAAFARRRRVR